MVLQLCFFFCYLVRVNMYDRNIKMSVYKYKYKYYFPSIPFFNLKSHQNTFSRWDVVSTIR